MPESELFWSFFTTKLCFLTLKRICARDRAEREKNSQWLFLAKEPACRVGIFDTKLELRAYTAQITYLMMDNFNEPEAPLSV